MNEIYKKNVFHKKMTNKMYYPGVYFPGCTVLSFNLKSLTGGLLFISLSYQLILNFIRACKSACRGYNRPEVFILRGENIKYILQPGDGDFTVRSAVDVWRIIVLEMKTQSYNSRLKFCAARVTSWPITKM